MELLYVLVGGVIGLLGGLSTSWLSHRLRSTEARRSELLVAYSTWSGRVHEPAASVKSLDLPDIIEDLKTQPPFAGIANGDPTGKSRTELVKTWHDARLNLRMATAVVLLITPVIFWKRWQHAHATATARTAPFRDRRSRPNSDARGVT